METDVTVAANRSVWTELRHLIAEKDLKKPKEEKPCGPRNSRGR